ncbi:MAG: hypothetical protein IMZ41_02735 [Actinobacteria bacterium]|jgi:hypothetical protein|nr:hypothetical protein [Actinomycetota bacterium]
MEKEYEFNPGDVIQHKATGKIGVVLELKEEQNKREVMVRNSDNTTHHYHTFELVKMDDNFVTDRLLDLRKLEKI